LLGCLTPFNPAADQSQPTAVFLALPMPKQPGQCSREKRSEYHGGKPKATAHTVTRTGIVIGCGKPVSLLGWKREL
jgi:hypothetical protein